MLGRSRAIRNTKQNGFTIEGRNTDSHSENDEASPMQRKSIKRIATFSLLCTLTALSATVGVFAAPAGRGTANAGGGSAAAEMTAMVNEAGQRLSQMGYCAPVTAAKMDDRLRLALLAFQRYEGRKPTGVLDQTEVEALRTATAPVPVEKGYRHVEVDLKRQVLFIVEQNNSISLVLPISSGSGKWYTFQGKTERAVTPRGRFTVYNKINGWRKAPLGMIYYPCYFKGGWAIHGSKSVPNYPASHGCVRIPIPTAKELSDVLPVGTTVLVYDGTEPGAAPATTISQAR
jgi:L,D-transpeptidase-like protein